MTASRTVDDARSADTPARVRAYLRAVAAVLHDPDRLPQPPPRAADPGEVLLLERAGAVLAGLGEARRGLRQFLDGEGGVADARLRLGRDWAGLTVARTVVAVALGALSPAGAAPPWCWSSSPPWWRC